MILIIFFTPFFCFIRVPKYVDNSGYLLVYSDAIKDTFCTTKEALLMIIASICFSLAQLFSLWIIKNQNAM